MKNKSIRLYLSVIGLLLAFVAGWYTFAFLTQPEALHVPTDLLLPSITSTADISATPTHTRTPDPSPTPTSTEIIETPTQTPIPYLSPTPVSALFNGERAYEDVLTQVDLGPRIPGTEGHARAVAWMQEELTEAGWIVEVQESEAMGNPIRNVVAKRGDESPQIILGAHYDTRIYADNDPDPANHSAPVTGANDGASGVAVLLELARVLPQDTVPIWLVFFDAEDNGSIPGWDWILGSREFVRLNPVQPRAVVIVDMIGDADLNIHKERNSDPDIMDEIWAVAQSIENDSVFLSDYKHSMLDDHTPFLEAGIPAVDIIDFDYPYWHTVEDTPDKVSAASLQAVGETLLAWIMRQATQP